MSEWNPILPPSASLARPTRTNPQVVAFCKRCHKSFKALARFNLCDDCSDELGQALIEEMGRPTRDMAHGFGRLKIAQ